MNLFRTGETYVSSGVGDIIKRIQVRYNIDSVIGKMWRNRVEIPDRISFLVTEKGQREKRVTLKQTKIEVHGWVVESIRDEPVHLPDLSQVFSD